MKSASKILSGTLLSSVFVVSAGQAGFTPPHEQVQTHPPRTVYFSKAVCDPEYGLQIHFNQNTPFSTNIQIPNPDAREDMPESALLNLILRLPMDMSMWLDRDNLKKWKALYEDIAHHSKGWRKKEYMISVSEIKKGQKAIRHMPCPKPPETP